MGILDNTKPDFSDTTGTGSTAGRVPPKADFSDVTSGQSSEAPMEPATTQSYTVKSGDRLVFIAKKFSVSQEDLMALNKIKDPTKLQIGQTLKIPVKK